jgi:hypothetical protein
MISDKIKKIIFDKLYKDLSNVEIIPHEDSIWFIDRKEKYWYFEFTKSGELWWRYFFFTNFFNLFSMEYKEFEPIIIEWVEEVLNSKVCATLDEDICCCLQVEKVLNSKVSTTKSLDLNNMYLVGKVSATVGVFLNDCLVEEVLNSKTLPKT